MGKQYRFLLPFLQGQFNFVLLVNHLNFDLVDSFYRYRIPSYFKS